MIRNCLHRATQLIGLNKSILNYTNTNKLIRSYTTIKKGKGKKVEKIVLSDGREINFGDRAMIEDYGSGFHPLAVVAVLTMLYGLYWALIQQRKGGENYGKMAEETKANKKLLLEGDPFVVFIIGGPSSGKTTLAKELCQKFDMVYLNLSQMVDKELGDPTSPNYKTLANCLREGVSIPLSTITSVFRTAMLNSSKTKFMIDGFPRRMEQMIEFQDNVCHPNLVINLECEIEEQIKRFNKINNLNQQVINTRIDAYSEYSQRVVNYYRRIEKLANVSCLHEPNTILEHTSKIIDNLISK